jgi:hypothetical protein
MKMSESEKLISFEHIMVLNCQPQKWEVCIMTILLTCDGEPGEEGEPLCELVLQVRHWKPANIINILKEGFKMGKNFCAYVFPLKKSCTENNFNLKAMIKNIWKWSQTAAIGLFSCFCAVKVR